MARPETAARIVVIGGVAAGATAAARARRENEDAEIIILERGPYVSFASCGLPYFFTGEVAHRSALLIQSPETLAERYRLDVRTGHEVVAIDRAARVVRVRLNEHAGPDAGAAGSETTIAWDRLVLAAGSLPMAPGIPGADSPHCFTIRDMADLDRLHSFLHDHKLKHALVIGGGFIGLEMTEALAKRGLKVRLVETTAGLLPSLDPEFSHAVAECVTAASVEVHCSTKVLEISHQHRTALIQSHPPGHSETVPDEARTVPAEVVVLAIGTRTNAALAAACGLETGPSGSLRVNHFLQASLDPEIYVAGDLAEVPLRQTKQGVRLPLAGPANRQGRIAGANAARSLLAGPTRPLETYGGADGTWVVRVFGCTVGSTGISEKTAAALQLRPAAAIVHRSPRAAWMEPPGHISLKLVYDKENGQLLGGQAFGSDGVDKRIDVLATALHGKLGVRELQHLDLAYAPPFNSANDPVNFAAMVAANNLDGLAPVYSPAEFLHHFDLRHDLVLDVRMPSECANGHIPGSLNIPVDELRARLSEIPRDRRRIFVHCAAGFRAHLAVRLLRQRGFDNACNITGGWMSIRHFFPLPEAQSHH